MPAIHTDQDNFSMEAFFSGDSRLWQSYICDKWTEQAVFICILHHSRHQLPRAAQLCVGLHGPLPQSHWNFGWLDLIQALCIQPQPCELLGEMALAHLLSPPKPLAFTTPFCDDSWVLRRRDVIQISHWDLSISISSFLAFFLSFFHFLEGGRW